MPKNLNTRISLIGRLRDRHDDGAWNEFAEYYQNYIFAILRRLGVQVSDLEDLSQKVLLTLWEKLPEFDYRPEECRFRTWMNRIIRNKVGHYFEKIRRYKNDEERVELTRLNADDMSDAEIYNIYEHEWKIHIAELAWNRLESEFSVSALKCFEGLSKGLKAGDLAEQLSLKVNSVFVNRQRVQDRFHREIRKLNEELG